MIDEYGNKTYESYNSGPITMGLLSMPILAGTGFGLYEGYKHITNMSNQPMKSASAFAKTFAARVASGNISKPRGSKYDAFGNAMPDNINIYRKPTRIQPGDMTRAYPRRENVVAYHGQFYKGQSAYYKDLAEGNDIIQNMLSSAKPKKDFNVNYYKASRHFQLNRQQAFESLKKASKQMSKNYFVFDVETLPTARGPATEMISFSFLDYNPQKILDMSPTKAVSELESNMFHGVILDEAWDTIARQYKAITSGDATKLSLMSQHELMGLSHLTMFDPDAASRGTLQKFANYAFEKTNKPKMTSGDWKRVYDSLNRSYSTYKAIEKEMKETGTKQFRFKGQYQVMARDTANKLLRDKINKVITREDYTFMAQNIGFDSNKIAYQLYDKVKDKDIISTFERKIKSAYDTLREGRLLFGTDSKILESIGLSKSRKGLGLKQQVSKFFGKMNFSYHRAGDDVLATALVGLKQMAFGQRLLKKKFASNINFNELTQIKELAFDSLGEQLGSNTIHTFQNAPLLYSHYRPGQNIDAMLKHGINTKTFDQNWITKGNIFQPSKIYKRKGGGYITAFDTVTAHPLEPLKEQLEKIQKYRSVHGKEFGEIHDFYKTGTVYGFFDDLSQISEFMNTTFSNLPAQEKYLNLAARLDKEKSRAKAIDFISESLGLGHRKSANLAKWRMMKDIAQDSAKVATETNLGGMAHYTKSSQFVDNINQFISRYGNDIDAVINTMVKEGAHEEAINATLPVMFRKYRQPTTTGEHLNRPLQSIEEIFKYKLPSDFNKGQRTARYKRFFDMPQSFKDKHGFGHIDLGSRQTAADSFNRLFGKARKEFYNADGSQFSMGKYARTKFLGLHGYEKMNKAGKRVSIPGLLSSEGMLFGMLEHQDPRALLKMMGNANYMKEKYRSYLQSNRAIGPMTKSQIMKNAIPAEVAAIMNKVSFTSNNYIYQFSKIKDDTADVGNILADIFVSQKENQGKAFSAQEKYLQPEFAAQYDFDKMRRDAMNFVKEYHELTDINNLSGKLKYENISKMSGMLPMYKESLESISNQEFTKQFETLFNTISKTLKDEHTMFRLTEDPGGIQNLQIGILSEFSHEHMKAFSQGDNILKGDIAENVLNIVDIPIATGGNVKIGGNVMHNMFFEGLPEGINLPGNMQEKQFYTITDMTYAKLMDDKFINGLKSSMSRGWKARKALKELGADAAPEVIAKAKSEYAAALENTRKFITRTTADIRDIAVNKLDSRQGYLASMGVTTDTVQEGSTMDFMASSRTKIAALNNLTGEQLMNKAIEDYGQERALEHYGYHGIRGDDFGKSSITGRDILYHTPLGAYYNPISPRPKQQTNQLMFEYDIKNKNANPIFHAQFSTTPGEKAIEKWASTNYGDKFHPTANQLKAGSVDKYRARKLPMVGIITDIADTASNVIDVPGSTTMEGRSIISSNQAKRTILSFDVEKTVASHITDNIKIGTRLKHGELLGHTESGMAVNFQHAHEQMAEQFPAYMKEQYGMSSEEILSLYNTQHRIDKNARLTEMSQIQSGAYVYDIIPLADGRQKIKIRQDMPILPGTAGFFHGSKETMGVLHPSEMKALNIPEWAQAVVSAQSWGKSTREHIGAVLNMQSNLATAIIRDVEHTRAQRAATGNANLPLYFSEILSDMNISEEELYKQAKRGIGAFERAGQQSYEGYKIGNVAYEPAMLPSIYKDKEVLQGLTDELGQIGIFQPQMREVAGVKQPILYGAWDTAFDANQPFSRTVSSLGSTFHEGPRWTEREFAQLEKRGYNAISESLARHIDPGKAHLAQEYMKAAKGLYSGIDPSEIEHSITPDMFKLEKTFGDKAFEQNTLIRKLQNEGMYVELPTSADVHLSHLPKRELQKNISDINTVSHVYVPSIKPHYVGKTAMHDEIISHLYKLQEITEKHRLAGTHAGADVSQWATDYSRIIGTGLAGKKGLLQTMTTAELKNATIRRSAPGIIRDSSGKVMEMVATMNPMALTEQYGSKRILDLISEVEKISPEHGFLNIWHRHPTRHAYSTHAVRVIPHHRADPTNIGISPGSAVLANADWDTDLNILADIFGLDAHELRNTKDMTSIAQRIVGSDVYKEASKMRQRGIDIAEVYGKRMAAEYSFHGSIDDMMGQMKQLNSPDQMYARLMSEESTNKYLQVLHDKGLSKERRLEYLRRIFEAKTATKAYAGEVGNLSYAIQDMAIDYFSTTPGDNVRRQMEQVDAFATAVYQSSLSTKTTSAPPLPSMKKALEANVDMATRKTMFVDALKEGGVYNKFVEVAGEMMGGKTEADIKRLGLETFTGTFDMFHAFQHSPELGAGTYMSPMAYNRQFRKKVARTTNQGLESLSFRNIMEGIFGRKGATLNDQIVNEMFELGETFTKKRVMPAGIKLPKGKLLLGATVSAAAIGAVYGATKLLQGTPNVEVPSTAPPAPRLNYTPIFGKPVPKYEQTYIDVHARANNQVNNIDNITKMAVQNAVPMPLDGKIHISDARSSYNDIVSAELGDLL